MKRLLFPFSAIVVLAVFPHTVGAQSAKEKLVGTWEAKLELDEGKLKKMFEGMGLGEAEFKQALELIKPQFADFKITLKMNADGTSESHVKGGGQEKSDKGKWEVVEEKGKTVTVKGTDASGKEETLTLEFMGNDKFSLSVPELEKAPIKTPTFARKKQVQE